MNPRQVYVDEYVLVIADRATLVPYRDAHAFGMNMATMHKEGRTVVTNHVMATELPAQSLLTDRIAASDFIDCFVVESTLSPRDAAEIITSFPGWARFLLQIRYLVTAPFGLSNDGPPAADKVGAFPVEAETNHELIAGFNDKHLNFRVSVISREGRVFLATWVHTHNLGGKLYLKAILPFHVLIARDALSRVGTARSRKLHNHSQRE